VSVQSADQKGSWFPGMTASAGGNAALSIALAGLSYQLAPRAKISRRDQGGVLGLSQLKVYMRSNSWASEPFSGNSPFGAICSRGDLDPAHPKASGCNDAKVSGAGGQLSATHIRSSYNACGILDDAGSAMPHSFGRVLLLSWRLCR
jgi:hypothetical protein